MKKESKVTQNIINFEEEKRKREKMKNTKKSNITDLEESQKLNQTFRPFNEFADIYNQTIAANPYIDANIFWNQTKIYAQDIKDLYHEVEEIKEDLDIKLTTDEQFKTEFNNKRKELEKLKYVDSCFKRELVDEYCKTILVPTNIRDRRINRGLANLTALMKDDFEQWKETFKFEKNFIVNLDEENLERQLELSYSEDINHTNNEIFIEDRSHPDSEYYVSDYEIKENKELKTKFLQNLISDLYKREIRYYLLKSNKDTKDFYEQDEYKSNDIKYWEYLSNSYEFNETIQEYVSNKYISKNYIQGILLRKQLGLN